MSWPAYMTEKKECVMNYELEPVILISLIEFPDNLDEFARIVKPHHLSDEYAPIYQIMLALRANNEDIEAAKIVLKIGNNERLKQLFFQKVMVANPVKNIFSYIPEIQDNYKLKQQVEISKFLEQKARDHVVVEVDEILSHIKEAPTEYKTFKQWAAYIDTLPVLPRYQTGVSFLDYATGGGFEMAQLVLISGEPEAGKTSIGVQILENVSQGHKAAFFCFEFTARQYIASKLELNRNFANNENLYIINEGYEVGEVAENIRVLTKMGVKFFLIDSQMRLETKKARSMEEEETEKFSTLAKLAHSLEILIILIIQTSKTDPNNPMGSKKGGHESSITLRIEHVRAKKSEGDDVEFEPRRRVISIKKNKQTGKHFKEEVEFDPVTRTFKRIYNQSKDPCQTTEFKG